MIRALMLLLLAGCTPVQANGCWCAEAATLGVMKGTARVTMTVPPGANAAVCVC